MSGGKVRLSAADRKAIELAEALDWDWRTVAGCLNSAWRMRGTDARIIAEMMGWSTGRLRGLTRIGELAAAARAEGRDWHGQVRRALWDLMDIRDGRAAGQ